MKRTKKLDEIIINATVARGILGLRKEIGPPSTLTLKAIIKELQSQLKNQAQYGPAEPSWMKQDYYFDEQRKLLEEHVSQEAIKKLNA
jgi:hypothetical protein